MDDQGLIFNIQYFSIHDGPGIRTTIFMNGCSLQCPWCSNPESKSMIPQIYTRNVNCIGCGACVEACPTNAISISLENGRTIDWSRCNQCLECAEACVAKAIIVSGQYLTIDEIIKIVKKDEIFYRNSGGGITVSGGEPLQQSSFVAKLMKACKLEKIHTALDTTGYAPWEKMRKVVENTDLVLFDVKHMDTKEHKRVIGVDNELILSNLARTAELTEVWIRVPLITGFNDSDINISQIARRAKELNIKKISILPYHEGGKSKCDQFGLKYAISNITTPTDERLKQVVKICKDEGVGATVGS